MTFKDFLSLVRIPTVFSSMSNAFAGYYIGGGRGFSPALLAGIAAAALFIMAGMALNDIADKDVDARERPNRPIPSRAVSLRLAWVLALGMQAAGLALVAVFNPLSVFPALALCAAVFAYNFKLKSTVLGPASMGLCRALNLFTGMSLTWTAFPAPDAWPKGWWLALAALWAYICLVTYLARDEVHGNTRGRARNYFAGTAAWFIAWSIAAFTWFKHEIALPVVWVGLVLMLRGQLKDLAGDPSPKNTGRMVGAMLRVLPLLDVMAMLANGVPVYTALSGALWIVPAFIVGKWYYST